MASSDRSEIPAPTLFQCPRCGGTFSEWASRSTGPFRHVHECLFCGLGKGSYDGPITPADVADLAAGLTLAYYRDPEFFERSVEQARAFLEDGEE